MSVFNFGFILNQIKSKPRNIVKFPPLPNLNFFSLFFQNIVEWLDIVREQANEGGSRTKNRRRGWTISNGNITFTDGKKNMEKRNKKREKKESQLREREKKKKKKKQR